MKTNILSLLFGILLPFSTVAQGEWQAFYGSDAVFAYEFDGDTLWTISGSGLNCTNIVTGERTSWNRMNSDIPHYRFQSMVVNKNEGTIWLGKNNDDQDNLDFVPYIAVFDGTNWSEITDINNQPISSIEQMERDQNGDLWVKIGYQEVYHYSNGVFTAIAPPNGAYFSNALSPDFHLDKNNHLWMGISMNSQSLLGKYDGTSWTLHDISTLFSISWGGGAVASDSDNNIYVFKPAGSNSLLFKYDGLVWSSIEIPSGYSFASNQSTYLHIDKDDHLWLNTYPLWPALSGPLLEYDGQQWTIRALEDWDIPNRFASGIYIDPYDVKWIHSGSMYRWDGTEGNVLDLSQGNLPSNFINQLIFDEQHNKWAKIGIDFWRFDGLQWTNIGRPPGNPWMTTADNSGNLWLDTYDELYSFDGLTFINFPLIHSNGVLSNYLNEVDISKDGKIAALLGFSEVLIFEDGNTNHFSHSDFTVHLENVTIKPNSDTLYVLGEYDLFIVNNGSLVNTIDLPAANNTSNLQIAPV